MKQTKKSANVGVPKFSDNGLSTHPHYALEYKREGDAIDARPIARRIRKAHARADYGPGTSPFLKELRDLEYGVYVMNLCAGNQLAIDAPLDTQYLAAAQRNSDFQKGRILCARVEVVRSLALCHATISVENSLIRLEKAIAAKGGAA